ncbi:hypothetical protein ACH4U7_07540 [Streptomyces sp. NPDC020845]|uniref:hypothetical protein n=1 Tax=Streptomyces sp. NPDC020845 TaxID=3365096 RepID=UPI0037B405FD
MRKHSAKILETLPQLLLPSRGRHRAADSADGRPARQHQDVPTMRPCLPDTPARPMATECAKGCPVSFRLVSGPLDARRAAVVRPYVTCGQPRERRTERRLRRRRQRTLWLAVHGIDIGPRVIHGVRVVA